MVDVIQALHERRSARAFLPKAVDRDELETILEAAVRAPSWGNSQPWEVFVARGDALARIREGYRERYERNAPAVSDIPHPSEWTEAIRERQKRLRPDMLRDCGEEATSQFVPLNQALFDAPVVVYLCMDRVLSEWSMYDLGAFSQSLMLAALDRGLSTIPAVMLVRYADVLRRELGIPDNLKVVMGIAVGYADGGNRINDYVSGRSPLSDTVRFSD